MTGEAPPPPDAPQPEPPWTQERMDAYQKIANMPMVCKSIDFGGRTLDQCVEMAIDRAYQHGRKDAAAQAERRSPPPEGEK